jgi:hypothetical protein
MAHANAVGRAGDEVCRKAIDSGPSFVEDQVLYYYWRASPHESYLIAWWACGQGSMRCGLHELEA